MKKIKSFIKDLKSYDYIRYFLWLVLIVLAFVYSWIKWLYLVAVVVAVVFTLVHTVLLMKRSRGNGAIYGGRGKGKGVLLAKIIKKDKTKPFVNVPYHKCLVTSDYLVNNNIAKKDDIDFNSKYVLNSKTYDYIKYNGNSKEYHTELLENIGEYLNSIQPLKVEDFINGITPDKVVVKNEKFEGRNVYIDDINTSLPNWADTLLKRKYDSMPPFLAINRHTYNAYCVITTQDKERPYKIIKELQTDFSIKAVKTLGNGFLWKCVPVLNSFVYTKYIYHELPKSVDLLPFSKKGLINSGLDHAYLTSGGATKEVYEATNGKISYGHILQLKKSLNYDTRYFHLVVYGKPI